MESNATVYELINKNTSEVVEVTGMEFADGFVNATTAEGVVRFENPNKDGNLENEMYAIREVGTNSQPDGTGTVTDEGVDVDEDGAPESAGEAETVAETE